METVGPLVPIIAAIVAVVASGVGVIVAVDQLTLRSRLRRTAEMSKALALEEENEHRLAVLHSIHDVAVARLAAGWVVPWWRFAELAIWAFLGPVAVGLAVARAGWSESLVASCLASLVACQLGARRGIRIFLERQRIARAYLAKVPVTPPQIGLLHTMEGGTRVEIFIALQMSVGINSIGFGVDRVRCRATDS